MTAYTLASTAALGESMGYDELKPLFLHTSLGSSVPCDIHHQSDKKDDLKDLALCLSTPPDFDEKEKSHEFSRKIDGPERFLQRRTWRKKMLQLLNAKK